MKKKSLIITIISSILAVCLIIGCVFIVTKSYTSKYDGTIKIEYVLLDGTKQKEKDVKFKKGDTLQALIEANFDNVLFEDSGYGPFLKNIEDFESPADYSQYVSVLVDGEYSMVGIGSIEFVDGTVITLKIDSYTPGA